LFQKDQESFPRLVLALEVLQSTEEALAGTTMTTKQWLQRAVRIHPMPCSADQTGQEYIQTKGRESATTSQTGTLVRIANNRQSQLIRLTRHSHGRSQSVSTSCSPSIRHPFLYLFVYFCVHNSRFTTASLMKRECGLTLQLNEYDVTDSICSTSTMPGASLPRRRWRFERALQGSGGQDWLGCMQGSQQERHDLVAVAPLVKR
jgi:hypothetical protein